MSISFKERGWLIDSKIIVRGFVLLWKDILIVDMNLSRYSKTLIFERFFHRFLSRFAEHT